MVSIHRSGMDKDRRAGSQHLAKAPKPAVVKASSRRKACRPLVDTLRESISSRRHTLLKRGDPVQKDGAAQAGIFASAQSARADERDVGQTVPEQNRGFRIAARLRQLDGRRRSTAPAACWPASSSIGSGSITWAAASSPRPATSAFAAKSQPIPNCSTTWPRN